MEIEINKLKLEYDKITPPDFLTENGVNDLWLRVDEKNNHSFLFYGKFIFAGALLFLVILTGITTKVGANAEPNSALYPVRVLKDKAESLISSNEKIENIEKLKVSKPQPSKSKSPTPSPVLKFENKNNENNNQNTIQGNEIRKQIDTKTDDNKNNTEVKEEVKGTRTDDNSKNENSNNSNDTNQNTSKENGQSNNPSSNPGKGIEMSEVHKKEK